ncbi:MAG TPA: (2Fe-2S)-binding protein [bacterium]|nr:(2Fe-2S)-binding protein [bacterium]
MTELTIAFTLNGERREVRAAAHETLLTLLRDGLGATEVKDGCGEGVCGTCTVLLDGEPVSSCLLLAARAAGRRVTTVRGLAPVDSPATMKSQPVGSLSPLQQAFVTHGAAQCGFCTPGMLLTAHAFLQQHPRPTRDDIRRAISGNLCRCTGYAKIIDAIEAASAGDAAPAGSAGGRHEG